MFIFVELFCVGEKIGFDVLDFRPAGPDTEPGQRTFAVFWFSEFSFKFLNLLISKSTTFCVTREMRLFGDFRLPQ